MADDQQGSGNKSGMAAVLRGVVIVNLLILVTAAAVLYGVVNLGWTQIIERENRVVWVAPPGACCAKDCSSTEPCPRLTRGFSKGMEFIPTYPHYVDLSTQSSDSNSRDGGLDLRGYRQDLVQLVKETAEMCSTHTDTVSLSVAGFADDQMPQGDSEEERERKNLSYANTRAKKVVASLCESDAKNAGADSVKDRCEVDDKTKRFKVKVDEKKHFTIDLKVWQTHDEMVQKRPQADFAPRMRFLHRSVRLTVENAGACSRDKAKAGSGATGSSAGSP